MSVPLVPTQAEEALVQAGEKLTRTQRVDWCVQVKEALMTSALLKLPQSLSRARKEERVEQILEELVSSRQP